MLDIFNRLKSSKSYIKWASEHENILSHFFCTIDNKGKITGNWEAGFFDLNSKKVTTFVISNEIFIKAEGEIIGNSNPENLDVKEVKVTFDKAILLALDFIKNEYPNQNLGNGFVSLSKGKWDITFITTNLYFLKVQISSIDEGLITAELIKDVVEKK